jgi:nucleoid DNA-binding protein
MPLSGTLTKAHIIDSVAEKTGYTRKKSIEIVETVLELIKRSLESGEDVLISGFGKFSVKKKANEKAGIRLPERICCSSAVGWPRLNARES